MCDALHYLLDNIFIRFGSDFVVIPMGSKYALLAYLFLFCYERDFMLSLSDNNQAYIIEAFLLHLQILILIILIWNIW